MAKDVNEVAGYIQFTGKGANPRAFGAKAEGNQHLDGPPDRRLRVSVAG